MPRGQKFPLEVTLRAMREVDNGVPVSVVCRKIGMVEKTFYRYREKYAGMEPTEATARARGGELAPEEAALGADASQRGAARRARNKMVRPAMRRQAVRHAQASFGLSERGACRALGVARASHRYTSTKEPPVELVARMRKLAASRPRAGYRTLGRLLLREGIRINHKRVYRLYRVEGLSIRIKRRRRFAASPRQSLPPPTKPGQRWAMDFVFDRTSDGHRFRILTLLDTFTRRAPGVILERSIGGLHVARFLDRIAAEHGYPEAITVDNGPEFISNALDQWAHSHSVRLHFSRPRKPVDNAFIESFNGRLRDECLNTNWFYGLEHAREVVNEWLEDYNERRPHSSLGGLTPAEFEKMQVRTSSLD